ncbi:hypothetical protein CEXT_242611 [Caerostris extrusa]|uniref:Uncharacterized protein n=1 Tax=Caerostris extrusa TaxID=172846 RepID=A0AAV4NBY4_CAEEX|nr:hypothetical protein CEXT_242611 [Caerostris extrusa]
MVVTDRLEHNSDFDPEFLRSPGSLRQVVKELVSPSGVARHQCIMRKRHLQSTRRRLPCQLARRYCSSPMMSLQTVRWVRQTPRKLHPLPFLMLTRLSFISLKEA